MSSYLHPSLQEDYYGYSDEQLYVYDHSTSFGDSSQPMTATDSSQSKSSTSSYTETPISWQWSTQQQCYVPISTTMLSFSAPENEAYIQPGAYLQQQPQSPPENLVYVDQLRYAPQQQQLPTQDLPHNPRSGGSGSHSSPKQFICLEPFCGSKGRFTRAADLTRHQNTVHDIKKRHSCPRPHCPRKGDRGFSRKDHLIEHLRMTHGRDIPLRRKERASS